MAFKNIQRLIFIASFVLLMLLSFCLGNLYANEKIRLFIATGEEGSEWKEVSCDPPPIIMSDRVFVPLRFVAENLGAVVKWDDEQKAVYIKSNEVVKIEENRERSREQQKKINQSYRSGEAVSVEPDKLTIKWGDKTITVRTDEYTRITVGMSVLNKPGEKMDLTKVFRPGDYVHMFVENDRAISIGRDLRPGEKIYLK